MFRLSPSFWEEMKKKYRGRPILSANDKALTFSVPRLSESIGNFIESNLNALDPELYKMYSFKSKLSYTGYKKDNLYRLFQQTNPEWNPTRDLIDLLCFYTFELSYEKAVQAKKIENNLDNFFKLKTHRDSIQEQAEVQISSQIENKLLNYHKKKIDLAIDYSDDLDLILESFGLGDLDVLEHLKPLKESLGDIHWDIIAKRLRLNKNLVRGLKVVTPIDRILVGFFILYPVTKECDMLIKERKITKSDQFEIKHLCENFSSAYSVYISLVFAVDRYSRAFLLLKLRDELFTILLNHDNLHNIYVRPTTEDGVRNVEKNTFKQMENSPGLYFKTRVDALKFLEFKKQLKAVY